MVVPFNIPEILIILSKKTDSLMTLIIGMPPATAASNWSKVLFFSAISNNLFPFFDSKGQGAFDIKTYAAAVLGKDFTEIQRDNYPKELHDNSKHSHKAIEDAREYSQLLIKLFSKS